MAPPIPEQRRRNHKGGRGHPHRRAADRVDAARLAAFGGEMAARIGAFDWSATPLGPIEDWPISLRATAAMVLENPFPMTLLWGRELRHLYNDGYIPVLGDKHPAALGQPAPLVWAEIWPILGPQTELILAGKGATWNEHLLLPMDRKGFLEETYFTFSYSPVRDDGGAIGGLLVTCQETTVQVQGERQLHMLRELGAGGLEAKSAEAACERAARILANNDADIPFALLYLLREETGDAELVATAGMDGYEGPGKPERISASTAAGGWPLDAARAAGSVAVVSDLGARFGRLPSGRWTTPPERAVVLGLHGAGQPEPYGFLIAGVSPLRILDERYKAMFQLAVDQIVSAIGAARAFEEERERGEALAALDRAKTSFFSNVSHEFRTPLMLMLGPTEDLLGGLHGELAPAHRAQLELLHRNAVRLHKLVNSLLDFSRLEAGRIQACYEPVDLAALTRDLASSFRSAVERAGLRLDIDCPPLDQPIFVDRDMWEKIELNLISNALKFTFEGRIEVSLRPADGGVALRVEDTGVGIPAGELPRLFDRFYRVEGMRARTHEGSGIGLALVHELARLHGGGVQVESELGAGTTFTVTLPAGSAHLPADRIRGSRTLPSTALGAAPFVEEALRWLQGGERPAPTATPTSTPTPTPAAASARPASPVARAGTGAARILVADDNADMRDYVRRLLEPHWTVEVVGNGLEALAAVEAAPPDLVLTDVMMPVLDGFGLLRRLRADARTRPIPVMMVSARAGEEAEIEGLQAGADDYLTKPYSARELLARVETQLKLARLRVRAETERERFYALLEQAPVPIAVYEGPDDLRVAFRNAASRALGATALALPELRRVYGTGESTVTAVTRLTVPGAAGVAEPRLFDVIRQALRDDDRRVVGVIEVAFEITAQMRARRQVEESEARFRAIFELAEVSIWEADFSAVKRLVDGLKQTHGPDLRRTLEENPAIVQEARGLVRIRDVNPATLRMFGAEDRAALMAALGRIRTPESAPMFSKLMLAIADAQRTMATEATLRTLSGERIGVALTLAFPPDDPAYERALVTLTDLSAQKLAEREREARLAEMEAAVRFGEMLVGVVGHDLRNPLSAITAAASLLERRADSERIARPVHRIAASAERMERMIAQLLDFTRIRLGGGLPLARARVDLAEIARSIIDELDPVYQRGIRLRCEGDVVGTWDRDRLSQLLSNLAANACQHGAASTPVEIVLDGTAEDLVRVGVHNGGAIPPELLPTIFEPLGHAGKDPTRRGGAGGLGLGLYITQQIAVAHGGGIRVESTERDGTRFVVELPRGPR